MQILRMHSRPIEQVPDLDAYETRLGQWCRTREYGIRFLAYSLPFQIAAAKARLIEQRRPNVALAQIADPLLMAIDDVVKHKTSVHPAEVIAQLSPSEGQQLQTAFGASSVLSEALRAPRTGSFDVCVEPWCAVANVLAKQLWALPWQEELLLEYDRFAARRRAEYYLVTWEPPTTSAEALEATLAEASGRPVERCDRLPSLIRCAYRPRATYLEPRQRGAPYLAILLAYDLRAEWNAVMPLHRLMAQPFDLAIAVDIQTLSHDEAFHRAELAYRAAGSATSDPHVKDTGSEQKKADAARAMRALAAQALHDVQIAVLITGNTLEELEQHIQKVKDTVSSHMSLTRVEGAMPQRALLKLWSLTPAHQLNIPWKRRNMLSNGVGCCLGLIGYHRASTTTGVYWGVEYLRNSVLFFDLFADNQAAHMVYLGGSGFGKTTLLNAIALRSSTAANYRIIGLDAFRNSDRIAAAAGMGANCISIGMDKAINLLDVVFEDHPDRPGSWLVRHVHHVISQIALLFGDAGKDAYGRGCYFPRRFSIVQRGVLDRALTDLYTERGITPDSPLDEMPILSDLIDALEQIGELEADDLARELRILIFGSSNPAVTTLTTLGQSFNAHTQIAWDFERHDITYYDFSQVDVEHWKAFYYAQAIGAIKRYMRQRQDLSRPILLQLDEFGYAAQIASVMELAVEICKTARKYRVGVMLCDQNPVTFLGNDQGRQIIENTRALVLFQLKAMAAQQVGDAIQALTPEHLQFLMDAPPGKGLAVVERNVYYMDVRLNPKEYRALLS